MAATRIESEYDQEIPQSQTAINSEAVSKMKCVVIRLRARMC